MEKRTFYEKVESAKEPIPEGKFSVPVVFKTGVIAEMFAFDVKPDMEYLRETSGYVFSEEALKKLLFEFHEESWGYAQNTAVTKREAFQRILTSKGITVTPEK